MLTVFVFDERESRHVEELRPALDLLGENALLWRSWRRSHAPAGTATLSADGSIAHAS
jgi:hypothetical protein